MSGSDLKTLRYVWEWSGSPRGCPGVVGRPSHMSGSGREASRLSGSGREALPDVRDWSGDPPRCPGVVGRPSWMSRSCWESI